MRKERNLERRTEPNRQNKRRKINETEYEEVKENWGRPDRKESGEKRTNDDTENPPKKKMRQTKIGEKFRSKPRKETTPEAIKPPLENNEKKKNIEIDMTLEREKELIQRNKGDKRFHDIEKIWRELEERRENQEREDMKRKEKALQKEKTWEIIRFCRDYIKTHEGEWMKRQEEELEKKIETARNDEKKIRFGKIKEKKAVIQEKKDKETIEAKI